MLWSEGEKQEEDDDEFFFAKSENLSFLKTLEISISWQWNEENLKGGKIKAFPINHKMDSENLTLGNFFCFNFFERLRWLNIEHNHVDINFYTYEANSISWKAIYEH